MRSPKFDQISGVIRTLLVTGFLMFFRPTLEGGEPPIRIFQGSFGSPPFISHGEQPQLGNLLTMVVNNPLFLADGGFGEAEVP